MVTLTYLRGFVGDAAYRAEFGLLVVCVVQRAALADRGRQRHRSEASSASGPPPIGVVAVVERTEVRRRAAAIASGAVADRCDVGSKQPASSRLFGGAK